MASRNSPSSFAISTFLKDTEDRIIYRHYWSEKHLPYELWVLLLNTFGLIWIILLVNLACSWPSIKHR
jgi:hypothetical protein